MKSLQLHRVLFAVLALCGPVFGQASNVYITRDGNGSKNGTSLLNAGACDATPGVAQSTCAFFNNASNWGTGAAQIGPGTTINIGGDGVTITATAGTANYFIFQGSGTAGHLITFYLETTVSATYWSGAIIDADNTNYVLFNTNGSGILQASNNGTAANQQDHGVGIHAFSSSNIQIENFIVSNLYIHTCTLPISNCTDEGGQNTYGFDINVSSNVQIGPNNVVHDVKQGIGAGYASGSTNIQIFDNTIYHSSNAIVFGDGNYPNGAEQATGSPTATCGGANGNMICGNTVYDGGNWDDVGDFNHEDGLHTWANYTGSFTAAFTNGSASIGNSPTPNAFFAGELIQFTTTGTLPTNFSPNTDYCVLSTGLTSSHFEVSATCGGSAIVAGSAGSGTQTVSAWSRYYTIIDANYIYGTWGYDGGSLIYTEAAEQAVPIINNILTINYCPNAGTGILGLATGTGLGGNGAQILNNTIVGDGTSCETGIQISSTTNPVIKNNIVANVGTAVFLNPTSGVTGTTADYNDYHQIGTANPFYCPGHSGVNFTTWQNTCGFDANGTTGDPLLNASSSPPYQLSGSSGAAYQTATNLSGLGITTLNSDYNGNARSAPWTMGAFNPPGTPTASTPTFSPIAGSYRGPQTVSISAGAAPVICWNTTGAPATNGTTGCTTGTLYTGAITVSATETLYAIAGGTGYLDGSIASATYTINAATRFIPIYGYLTSTAAPTSIAPGVDGAIVPAIQSAVDNTTCSAGPPITCPLSYSWTTPTGYINNWTGLGANGCAATLRGNSGESCSVGLNLKSVANGSANSSAPAYIGTQLAADFACQQNLFQPTFTYYVGQCFYASSHYFYISNPNTNGSCVSGSSTPNPGDSTSGSCSIHDNGTSNAPPQDFAFESSYGDAPVWAASTAYTAGTVEWNTAGGNNFFYVAQANCTSGTGPSGGTWNTTQGGTTNDNGGTGGCNWTTEKTVVMNVNTSVRDSANDPATGVPYYMSGIPFIWETTWRYFQDAFYDAAVQNYASTPLAFVRAGGGTGEEQSTHAIQAMENNWTLFPLNDTQMETLWIYAVEEKEQSMANTWNAISPVPFWHMEELVNPMTSLSNGGGTDMAPANAYIRNVFSLATLGGNCSAPTYLCNSLSTATVQTPAAPFNTTTLTNSTAPASEFANNTILRVTDPTTGGGVCGTDNQFNISHSQGSNDVDLNTTSTLIVVTCAGNTNYFLGMNPNAGSFAVFPAPPATLFNCSSGPVGFSRVNQLVAYCLPINGFSIPGGGTANGSTVYKITFALASGTNLCGLGVGNCPDPSTQPTWSAFYDFRNCSQATNAAPVSASIFGVAPGDAAISLAMSWTGGQGTAHLFFQYVPGVGCYTLDTVGNGTNPVWYTPSGTPTTISSVACSFSIHDAFTYGTYASVQIASGTQSGSGCGAGDGSPIWQVATSNLIMYSTQSFVGGHFTMTPSYYFSFPDPQFYRSTLASPSTNVQVAAVNCAGVCQDAHINGDATSDTNPILGTTGGTANATWSGPYKSEVIAYATNGTGSGTIWRITHTYSTGTAATSFPAEYGIGVPSQDRKLFCWTSDMLGNLGTTTGGLNRWDVFCVNLTSGDLGATPPFIGYGSNGLSTKDLNNILTPFCAVSTPTGCYGTSYCSNNWCSQRPFTYGIFPLISMQEGNTSNAASPTGTTPNAICSTSDNHSGACPGATQPNPDLELQQVLVLALQHGANQIELGPCEIEAAFLTPCTGSYAASHPSTVAAYATAIQNAALGLPVQVSAAGGHGHGGGTGHFQ